MNLSALLGALNCACRLLDFLSPLLVKAPAIYTAPVKTLELYSYGPF